MGKSIDDIIQEGIHGPRELKPDERRKFLGNLRERILVVLRQSQVREPGTYKEISELMSKHPKVKMYLNGNINYTYLRDYIKLANQHHIRYSMVTNKKHNTEIGLVLAFDHAIDKDDIFIEKEEEVIEEKEEKGFLEFVKNIFKID